MSKTTPMTDPETGLAILRGRISCNDSECCQITIPCPFCRCNHIHGWLNRTTDPNHLEHRVCHCFDTARRGRTESPFHERGYLIGISPGANNAQYCA